jgi:hypothetical protein
MTGENNIMESKKKSTKGILLSVGVWMMISYGTFGSEVPPQKPDLEDVLPYKIIYEVFGEDKKFKEFIDGLNKLKRYRMIEYQRCCCLRGNVLDALAYNKDSHHRTPVRDLIYEALDLDKDNSVQLRDSGSTLSEDTGVYGYIMENNVLWALNNAIQEQALKSENELQDIKE